MRIISRFKRKTALTLVLFIILNTLTWIKVEASSTFLQGNGTEGNPFVISTAEQLYAVNDALDASYILERDIDLSGYQNGTWYGIGHVDSPFTGTFDGNGFTINGISNFKPEPGSNNYNLGLFSYMEGAKIQSLGVVMNQDSWIDVPENTGETYSIGLIVGSGSGEIYRSYALGDIVIEKNANYAGLIAGQFSGNIEECYSVGKVSIESAWYNMIGGLIGKSEATIRNCFSFSEVYSSKRFPLYGNRYNYVGLLAGSQKNKTIENSYGVGTVFGITTQGIIGTSENAAIVNSFYNKQISGIEESIAGTGKTTAELQQSETYSTWDTSNVWNLEKNENGQLPYLISVPLNKTLSKFSKPYLLSISPLSNLTIVEDSIEITLVFDRDIILAKTSGFILESENGEKISLQVELKDTHTISINTIEQLTYNQTYHLQINEDAIRDENIENLYYSGLGHGEWSVSTSVMPFDGGNGDKENPFLISKPEQLDGIRYNLDKAYKLTADLDLGLYKNGNWESIGNESTPFTGILDGNNHEIYGISNFYTTGYDTPEMYYYNANYGLFSTVDKAQFKNLGVILKESLEVPIAFNSSGNFGIILGKGNASLHKVYAVGKVNVMGSTNAGLLAGELSGTVNECYSAGKLFLQFTGSWYATGGLIGKSSAQLSDCYSYAEVLNPQQEPSWPNGFYGGGLVGLQENNSITNSYSSGSLYSGTDIGGLVGKLNNGSVVNSYYNHEISGMTDDGKGEGKTTEELQQNETYQGWDFDSKWAHESSENGNLPYLRNTPLHKPLSKFVLPYIIDFDPTDQTTIVDDHVTVTMKFDRDIAVRKMEGIKLSTVINDIKEEIDVNVTIPDSKTIILKTQQPLWFNSSYSIEFEEEAIVDKQLPLFSFPGIETYRWTINTSKVSFDGGTGEIDNPYLISTPEQMQQIRHSLDSSYKLINDLDLSSYSDGEWTVIGTSSQPFTGSIDGDGHEIRGLKSFNYPWNETVISVGLFAFTEDASIKNIGVRMKEGVEYGIYSGNGKNVSLGLLIGSGSGTIINSHAVGNINITHDGIYVGLLAGKFSGMISSSYTSGKVRSDYAGHYLAVGGLVGKSNAEITDSYTMVDVSTEYTYASHQNYAGGLVGHQLEKNVKNSFSVASVKGQDPRGLIGNLDSGFVSNSFYDKDVSGLADDGAGIGKTTQEMKNKATYAGWNFNTVWEIQSDLNQGYPFLKANNEVDPNTIISDLQYLVMSELAYQSLHVYLGPEYKGKPIKDFIEELKPLNYPDSDRFRLYRLISDWSIEAIYQLDDFSATVFKHTISGKEVFAIRGSGSFKNEMEDWINNFVYGAVNIVAPQMYDAIIFFEQYLSETSNDLNDISLTGHSLGGGLATMLSNMYGITATTFNSSPTTDVSYYRMIPLMSRNFTGIDRWPSIDYISRFDLIGNMESGYKNSIVLNYPDEEGIYSSEVPLEKLFDPHARHSLVRYDVVNKKIVFNETYEEEWMGFSTDWEKVVSRYFDIDLVGVINRETGNQYDSILEAYADAGTWKKLFKPKVDLKSFIELDFTSLPKGSLHLGKSTPDFIFGAQAEIPIRVMNFDRPTSSLIPYTDVIYGGSGDDYLSGLVGDDRLIGGPGNDFLLGASGNDSYFYWKGDGQDTIVDAKGKDQLLIFGYDFDSASLKADKTTGRIYDKNGTIIELDKTTNDKYWLVKDKDGVIARLDKNRLNREEFSIHLAESLMKPLNNVDIIDEFLFLRIAGMILGVSDDAILHENLVSITVACPTTVFVKDPTGSIILELGNNETYYEFFDWGYVEVYPEEGTENYLKHIQFYKDGYSIETTALEDGEMNVYIEKCNEDNESILTNFNEIQLTNAHKYVLDEKTGQDQFILTEVTPDGSTVNEYTENQHQVKPVEEIQSVTEISLKVGETTKLEYTVTPENAPTINVKLTVLNSNIATIDEEGFVTAIAPGTTYIRISEPYSLIEKVVTVKVSGPMGLTVLKLPDKLEYVVGQSLDLTGLEVEITYEDGATEKALIQEENVIGFDSSYPVENQEITIIYEEMTATFMVKIISKQLLSLKIENLPDKTVYIVDEELDLTGLEVMAVYNDGSEVLLMPGDFELTGFNANFPNFTHSMPSDL